MGEPAFDDTFDAPVRRRWLRRAFPGQGASATAVGGVRTALAVRRSLDD